MSEDTAFNGETTPHHTILCSDSQCLPLGDPKNLCAKHEYPITGKSFILRKTGCITSKSQQSEGTPFDWLTFVGVTKGLVRFSQKVVI